MRLKKVKLAGFKSFVDVTNVSFPHQMTCVVGPNGCGKSNIIDAVRWVLGESSAKNLRGDDMTDVIFNGSTNRKAIGQASVELVFENTQGRIAGTLADRTEISIKRVVTQERKSTYYLNGTKCRRRDITDIFLGTGMGPRSYSIIEQGMISKLIESKPQELRVFLEEAAGISKYKERRKETETRIKHTRENLIRLDDIRSEVTKMLEKLKRQASTAQRYTDLKAEERKYKNELAALKFDQHNNAAANLQREINSLETELELFKANQTNSDKVLIELKVKRAELSTLQDEKQQAYYKLNNLISKTEQQITNIKQNKVKLNQEIQRTTDNLARLTATHNAQKSEINTLNEEIEATKPQLTAAENKLKVANEKLSSIDLEFKETQNNWQHLVNRCSTLNAKVEKTRSNIELENRLREQKKSRLTQISLEKNEITKLIANNDLNNLHTELNHFTNIKSVLEKSMGEKENARKDLDQAIEKSTSDVNQLLKQINELQGKKSSIEYLQAFDNDSDNNIEEELQKRNIAFTPILKQLAVVPTWSKAIENVIALFKNPLLVDHIPQDLKSASNLFTVNKQNPTPNSLASVIIKGDYPSFFNDINLEVGEDDRDTLTINQEGHISTNNWTITDISDAHSGYFEREAELKETENQILTLESKIEELKQNTCNSKTKSAAVENAIQITREELNAANSEITRINTQTSMFQTQINQANEKLANLSNEEENITETLESSMFLTEELEFSLSELSEEEATAKKDLPALEQLKTKMANALDSAREEQDRIQKDTHGLMMHNQSTTTKLEAFLQNIVSTEEQVKNESETLAHKKEALIELEFPLEDLNFELQDALMENSAISEENTKIKHQLEEVDANISLEEKGLSSFKSKEEDIKNKTNKLKLECEKEKITANTFLEQIIAANTTLNDIIDEISDDASITDWNIKLETIASAVSKIGPVNLTAIDEYETQKERKEYLDQQFDDLSGALDTLNSAIATIDKETRSKFSETFEKVNNGLQDLFPKVFGGGSAYLKLTDNDLLEAGVTIMARPPGKKNSTIHLLSGGEKALTALSLVFSIFKLNPAPFCMLDEVDAPLDDVNVGRFCRLVDSMSNTVQFIYISHNKVAMEMAHQLSGVTMQEPGVSRLVAVDVDEAAKLAQM